MSTDSSLKVTVDAGAIPALEAWAVHASLRGKDVQDSMRKAMRFAIDFAIAKVPKGSRERIRSDLMTLTRNYKQIEREKQRKRSTASRSETWRGTIAAAIVFKLNYNQARTAAFAKHRSFYQEVARFAQGRMFAANLHRAGFLPARRRLGRGRSVAEEGAVRLPSFRNMPGDYEEDFRDTAARILVENWASAAVVPGRPEPKGISGLLKDDLQQILPELAALFERFLAEDLMRAAERAGLQPHVKPPPAKT